MKKKLLVKTLYYDWVKSIVYKSHFSIQNLIFVSKTEKKSNLVSISVTNGSTIY